MAKAKTASPPAAKPVAKPEPVVAAKPAAPAPAPAKAAAKTAKQVDPQVRLRMIAEAAYYIAEKRGFIHGHHDADWAAAEKQIDNLLAR
ncbi:MAG TPA: DUF2934 domain-containing protein [Planctomycetes bacterium]|nr:DUF2934 domain-containing protein [Planctomycetota bacterium]